MGVEHCVSVVLKFSKKHVDVLHKCSDEVKYFLPRVVGLARHFVGPYLLRRLACQCFGRFLVFKGVSWTSMTELESVLNKNKSLFKHLKPKKPKTFMLEFFISEMLNLFCATKLDGPRWSGLSHETANFVEIHDRFETCLKMNILPPPETHIL